jgi:hypothetical protein
MNLSTTIALYFGGPGSGCNPDVGKCGRPPLAGRTVFQGLPISIEHKAGQTRTKKSRSTGKTFHQVMNYDYGYFLKTKAPDGDHLDVFIGPHKDSQNVFIFHQNKADGKTFDEDKIYLGWRNLAEARMAFNLNTKNMVGERFGGVEQMTMDEFKPILKSTWGNPRKLVN